MNTSANSGPPPRRKGPKLTSAEAQARLADALRDNLRRRKSQLRARDAQGTAAQKDDEPGGGKSG